LPQFTHHERSQPVGSFRISGSGLTEQNCYFTNF
jgi:hypothetical protein